MVKKAAMDIEEKEVLEQAETKEVAASSFFEKLTGLSNFNAVLITGTCLVILLLFVTFSSGTGNGPAQAMSQSQIVSPVTAAVTPMPGGSMASPGNIERKGEGRHFYTTIKIPPGAETLYLSGSGAAQKPDGSWGSMEEQTIDTFNSFKTKLEAEGWSMSDIVQVRAFAKAGEFGLLDFDGFNRAYREFFGTEENPEKPVRSFVQIADLVVPGWLVEIEVRAARVPKG